MSRTPEQPTSYPPATVTVVGGGLAGSECALALAARGIPVTLYEQRPNGHAPAHHTAGLAELVCSNSLKTTRADMAQGVLKAELDLMGCQLLPIARACAIRPDPTAPEHVVLSVDRERFSAQVTAAVEESPLITLVREELQELPDGPAVIAAGPLCSPALAEALGARLGTDYLMFYDASAPMVAAESIDRAKAFAEVKDGVPKRDGYLHCPLNQAEFEALHRELVCAKRAIPHDFERADLFDSCEPIEETARRGAEVLLAGPLSPMQLTDPRTGEPPYAAVHLRAENDAATAYNLASFQTNLTWGEQQRVFRLIPGLEQAEFVRYGVMHLNTYVDTPRVLDATLAIPGTQLHLAGQIVGTDGYMEAIATGTLVAANVAAELRGDAPIVLPATSVLGALIGHITDPATYPYQPMHVNYGLVPPIEGDMPFRERRALYAARALADMRAYLASRPDAFNCTT